MTSTIEPDDRFADAGQDSEPFDHPTLSEEEDRVQRGEDPATIRRDPPPKRPEPRPEHAERLNQVRTHVARWMQERGRNRHDGLWPYLLIRAYAGDTGARPVNHAFWESPDILVVPGVVDTYDGHSATLNPRPGEPHTIFVHVWNLGRLPAIGVQLRVYWANPTFTFDDPTHPPQLIAGMNLNLPDRQAPDCHQLFRLPVPWTPVWENEGHECLLAKVECFADGGGPRFDPRVNRHVAQRNLVLVHAGQDLAPLFVQLGNALPEAAELRLVHGLDELQPVLLAHQPDLVKKLVMPTVLPSGITVLAAKVAELGTVVKSAAANMQGYEVRHSAGPDSAGRIAPNILDRAPDERQEALRSPVPTPEGRDAAKIGSALRPEVLYNEQFIAQQTPTQPASDEVKLGTVVQKKGVAVLLQHLAVTQLTPGALIKALAAQPGEGHLLRFQASRDGHVLGGYTVVVAATERVPEDVQQSPLNEKYMALGSSQGWLGAPTSAETPTPDTIGRYRHFQGGSIYWSPQTGAHEVHGAIRDLWAKLGWERSKLGYPTSDELPMPDGVGRSSHFQHGSISWTPERGTQIST